MALYFAVTNVAPISTPAITVYSILVSHFSKVPAGSVVPALLPPIPHNVAWLRLMAESPNVYIMGTTDSSPYYGPMQKLDAPIEFPAVAGRNTIDLSSIYLQVPAGGANIDITFSII